MRQLGTGDRLRSSGEHCRQVSSRAVTCIILHYLEQFGVPLTKPISTPWAYSGLARACNCASGEWP